MAVAVRVTDLYASGDTYSKRGRLLDGVCGDISLHFRGAAMLN